jgi:3-isopropylmalate/(R)-2-methylmalate dehydratase large subunit
VAFELIPDPEKAETPEARTTIEEALAYMKLLTLVTEIPWMWLWGAARMGAWSDFRRRSDFEGRKVADG